MTADTAVQQPAEERPEPPRVLMAPEWVLAQNLFGGIGAGIVAYCYPQLQGDTWGSVAEAVAVAGIAGGGLCIIRFGIDEIALLTRVIVTQSLIASKRAQLWAGKQKLLHDIRVVIAHADRLEKENAQLRARVSLLEKKKGGGFERPPEETKAEREATERWKRETQAAFDASYAELVGEVEENEGVAPTLDLDDSVEQCFADAGALLEHYEQFGSLAKGNAYQNSGITNRAWDRAKEYLLESGAARMEGNALTLAVSTTLEADVLLDSYREQLARQLHG